MPQCQSKYIHHPAQYLITTTSDLKNPIGIKLLKITTWITSFLVVVIEFYSDLEVHCHCYNNRVQQGKEYVKTITLQTPN